MTGKIFVNGVERHTTEFVLGDVLAGEDVNEAVVDWYSHTRAPGCRTIARLVKQIWKEGEHNEPMNVRVEIGGQVLEFKVEAEFVAVPVITRVIGSGTSLSASTQPCE